MLSRMIWWTILAQPFRGEGKGLGIGIAVLTDKAGKINRGGAKPWGRPRLHPPHLETEPLEGGGKLQGGDLPGPACGIMDIADVDEAPEEGSRGDHNRPAAMKDACLIDDAADPPVLDNESLNEALAQVEAFFLF